MLRTRVRCLACCGTLAGACFATTATADITASFYDGQGSEFNFGSTLGWFFTPLQDVVVTQLGVYDLGAPGFAQEHDIGIFRVSDDSPVVTTTIADGLSGILIDGTRFTDVAGSLLTAGTAYYVVANNFEIDLWAFGTGHVTYASEIQWDGNGGGTSQDIFGGMTNFGPQEGNLGPNFRFVPGPGSIALFIVAIGFGRRRRP